eukprot:737230-Amphidinium_carterae.1
MACIALALHLSHYSRCPSSRTLNHSSCGCACIPENDTMAWHVSVCIQLNCAGCHGTLWRGVESHLAALASARSS